MTKTKIYGSHPTRLGWALLGALLLLGAVLLSLGPVTPVAADPIPPEEGGYPKFNLSVKTVTPTLANTGGVTLTYTIEVVNTGSYTAAETTVVDWLPADVVYNDDLQADVPFTLTVDEGVLTWVGDVGFDATATLTFSVLVTPTYSGTLENVAVISHPLALQPITVTAKTVVTDDPILAIEKEVAPRIPGANQPLYYTLHVINRGQPTVNLPITMTDYVPLSTTLATMGVDGFTSPVSDVVTWTRAITLDLGETTSFTFVVDIGDVPSSTVILNDRYQVESALSGIAVGEPVSVTVQDPIFMISKDLWPDPPGSNREVTYTLTVVNVGSLASNVVITDRVPTGTTYVRGGTLVGDVVSWTLPTLDTGGFAKLSFTVYVSDVFASAVINGDYGVCSAEEVGAAGDMVSSVVGGPTFETWAALDPVAKKPGGGGGPVTPTLVVRNLGPGNALDAQATLYFYRISVSLNDLTRIPNRGTLVAGASCGDKCSTYIWRGDLAMNESITFTTKTGVSTIGGEEGTVYSATVLVTDSFAIGPDTAPVTGTATGIVTHKANLLVRKTAPAVVGEGQIMTYTLKVVNTALGTDDPPFPYLIERVPLSTTVISASHGGVIQELSSTTVISWVLPRFGTGDSSVPARWFSVRVDDDLISGTQIVNDDYTVFWYETEDTQFFSSTGQVVTTTVMDVGLIHSFKVVTPALASPGPGNVLTYALHIVNSSALSLSHVSVYDLLPWEHSTYQRDAVIDGGDLVSDILSLAWEGDVGPLSTHILTLTVLVDADFQGVLTNTAVISHAGLKAPVVVEAPAYIVDEPALAISKSAAPAEVKTGGEIRYTLRVVNYGQTATGLMITDVIPANATYIPASASGNGELVGELVRWQIPLLEPGEVRTFEFRVTAGSGQEVVNAAYGARCAEGSVALGAPVVTPLAGAGKVYLPVVLRQ